MTRPSDITRERILKAAERLFADRGYEETSIRAIVAKARVNQAAINYHFGGKDGLYRECAASDYRVRSSRRSDLAGGRSALVVLNQIAL
jgi:AcrR family transcriptional regulator